MLTHNATVAQIVPDGELRIVASFRAAAIGRIVPGQPVRLRLEAFPWADFGSLRGEVLRVASESVGGLIRVECSIDPASAPLIPCEHGLGGALEIEVEHVCSPAASASPSAPPPPRIGSSSAASASASRSSPTTRPAPAA